MEYKRFNVKAFEREPGKWRASVERANGKVLLRLTSIVAGHSGIPSLAWMQRRHKRRCEWPLPLLMPTLSHRFEQRRTSIEWI